MKRVSLFGALALLCSGALAQQTIDGTADYQYSAPIVCQNVQTGFGDNLSELDVAYSYIKDGVLYLTLAGNLENNSNKLNIFVDSVSGGQNRLRGDNWKDFVSSSWYLTRLGDSGGPNGLKFEAGFTADHYFGINRNGGNLYLDYSATPDTANNIGFYLGQSNLTDGTLSGGTNLYGIKANYDGSNTAGTGSGSATGYALGGTVKTGLEMAIPLAAIGNPTGTIRICAFVGNSDNSFLSNQFLPGVGYNGGTVNNYGEPRGVDLGGSGSNLGTQYLLAPYRGTGNIVVSRLSGNSTSAFISFLEEWTTAATPSLIGTVNLPSSTPPPSRLLIRSSNLIEGQPQLGADGLRLAIGGYDIANNTVPTGTTPRVLGLVDSNRTVDTATNNTSVYGTANLRGVYTFDGQKSWTADNSALRYVPYAGTPVNITGDNGRSVTGFNNQLFVVRQTAINLVAPGMPEINTGVTSTQILSGFSEGYDIWFASATRCYVADVSIGVRQCDYNGSTWSISGNALTDGISPASGARSITGTYNSLGQEVLYVVLTDGRVYEITDTGTNSNTSRLLLTAPTAPNVYRGVELSPFVALNQAPTLTVPADSSIGEGLTYGQTATATDPDSGQTLTFTKVSGPAALTVSSGGAISWPTVEADGPGTYPVTIKVEDNGTPVLSDTKTFNITVEEVNQPPTLVDPADHSVDEDTLDNVTLSGSDPDLPAQTLEYSLLSGPGFVTGNTWSWTFSEADGPGDFVIIVQVDDLHGGTAQQSFTVHVNEANEDPTLNNPGTQSATEHSAFSVQLTGSDTDLPGQPLTYGLVAGPSGLTVGGTGLVEWTPGESDGGTSPSVTVSLSDGTATVQQSFTINVAETNEIPVLADPADGSVNEGVLDTRVLSATDDDLPAQTLTYSLVSGPGSVTGNTWSWTPGESDGGGTFTVTVKVEDDFSPVGSHTQSFQVTVNETNQAPVLTDPADHSVNEGVLDSVTLSASDADVPVQTLTYALVSGPGSVTGNTWTWTPGETDGPGVYDVTVSVTDGIDTVQQTFQVTVNEVNVAPVLDAIGNQSGTATNLITFTATASDADIPANTLTFSLDSGAPAGASITTGGVFTWTPTNAQTGDFTVTVRVTDNGSPDLDDFETITIHVDSSNQAPVLDPIGDKNVVAGSQLAFSATATDSDVPAQTLTYSLDSGAPAGASITAGGAFTWKPTQVQVGDFTVTVRVTDSGSPTLNDSETLTIHVTAPPVPTYHLTDLGTLGGGYSQGRSVNENGQVTGLSMTAIGRVHAFRYAAGTMLDLGTLDGNESDGYGINATGNVAGIASMGTQTRAFIYAGGILSNLGTLGGSSSFGFGINDLDQVTGHSQIGNGHARAFVYSAGVMTDIGTLGGDTSAGQAINNAGQVTGYASLSNGQYHAFLYSGGSMVDLGTFGGSSSFGYGLSADGQVTGGSAISAGNLRAFLYANGSMDNLGTLGGTTSVGYGVNLSGQVVGLSLTAGGVYRGFLYSGGVMYDVNDLLDSSGAGYTVFEANAISDNGKIVGTAIGPNGQRAVLLIPVNPNTEPPVLDPIGDQTTNELALFSYDANATDPNAGDVLTYSLTGEPAGMTIDGSTGVISWTPTEAQGPGAYTFDVVVTDNGSPVLSDSETITVTVNEVNVAPLLDPVGNQSVDELVQLSFTATASDSDLPAQTLTFSLSGAPQGAAISPSGAFTWTPTEAQGPGVFTFDVVVSDGSTTDFETITVTVAEVNVNPTLGDPSGPPIPEGGTFTTQLMGQDTDVPTQTLSYSKIIGPAALTVSPTGAVSWLTTEADGPGTYPVTVEVTDGAGGSAQRTFDIVVEEVNHSPIINYIPNQSGTTNNLITFTTGASDVDIPANTLTFSLDPGAPAGASITSGGVFTWTPTNAQLGDFPVTVRVTDNGSPALSDAITINIHVDASNTAPIADDQSVSTPKNTPKPITLTATDNDVPAQTLSYILIDAPDHGLVTGSVPNLTYWPNVNYVGPDSFTFKVNDGLVDSNVATVTIDVTQTPSMVISVYGSPAPNAFGSPSWSQYVTNALSALESGASSVGDRNTDPSAYVQVTNAPWSDAVVGGFSCWRGVAGALPPFDQEGGNRLHFGLRIQGNGTRFTLQDLEFAVHSDDPADDLEFVGDFVGANYSSTRKGIDYGPDRVKGTLDDITYTTGGGTSYVDEIIYVGVGNAWDASFETGTDQEKLEAVRCYLENLAPIHVLAEYKIKDGNGGYFATGSTVVTIIPTNSLPVANDQTVGVNEDSFIGITLTATDADNETLTYTVVDGPDHGVLSGTAPNLTYTPFPNYFGPDSFTFKATDCVGDSNIATVTINVANMNDDPTLGAIGNKVVDEHQLLTFSLSSSDIDGGAPIYSMIGGPVGATLVGNTFSWTPSEAQGPDVYSVTFEVSDGAGGVDSETISITVNEVNEAPVLGAIGTQAVDELQLLSFNAVATDPDLPANGLTYSLEGTVPPGASITSGGAFTWTPTESQGAGIYTFDVVVKDNGSPQMEDRETITINVNEVNVAPELAAIGNQMVDEMSLLTFTATASDADLPANTLTFSLDPGAPAGASITPAGVFTWTPTEAQGPGVYLIAVRVTDNGSPALNDFETIQVTVNEVPDAVSMTLNLSVPGFAGGGNVIRGVEIRVGGSGGVNAPVSLDRDVTFDASGNATIVLTEADGLTAGAAYTFVSVKDPLHTIRRKIALNEASTDTYDATLSLISGNMNKDNKVDIGDYVILALRYGTSVVPDTPFDIPGNPPTHTPTFRHADLNGDGDVAIDDYAILSANFGTVGDAEVDGYGRENNQIRRKISVLDAILEAGTSEVVKFDKDADGWITFDELGFHP